jgi:hypothetical protein
MKLSKDPAFLFYTQDWIVETLFMTMEERGVYITLKAFQHQNGFLTPEMIGKITEGIEYPRVMEKFVQGENGNWINVDLGNEMIRRKKRAQDQRDLANRRWANAKASTESDANASAELNANDMPRDVTDNVTDTKTITIKSKKTKSPKRLFKQDDNTQTIDSLEDLYSDSSYNDFLKKIGDDIDTPESKELDNLYKDLK